MSEKRIAVINDISCFGKCSLTVALPVLSAAGIETSVIPTAVLSTHTGYSGNTLRDLTGDILPIARHLNREGITFDAVFSGYLCSQEQITAVSEAIGLISREDTLVVVDPSMADNGRMYKGLSDDIPMYMSELCRKADVITPNLTEASLLLGRNYESDICDEEHITNLLSELYKKTGAKIVLTGIGFEEGRIATAVFDGKNAEYVFTKRDKLSYHGTGDIFSSTLIAAVLNGKSLVSAAKAAADFTLDCIRDTAKSGRDERFGLCFESRLPKLTEYIGR